MFSNKFIKELQPYKVSDHKAWHLGDDPDVLKLDWNESAVSPSPLVKQRLIDFISNGRLNWYPNINNDELINKISHYVNVKPSQVQYFGSSDYLHEYIARIYLDNNDRVIMVSPTYDNFRSSAASLGAIADYFYLDEDFKLNISKFESYLDQYQPKIVYICNPNNPTGTEISIAEIERLFHDFPNILFVIDEAYYEFSGITVSSLVNDYDNFIVTRTFSKAFSLASFRIGYAVSCEKNIAELSKIRNPKNIAQLSQIAAIAALDDLDYTKNCVQDINLAKFQFKKSIENLKNDYIHSVISGGGNYLLLKVDKLIKLGLISYLEDHKVFIRDYSHIASMENHLRISIGTSMQMLIVFNLLCSYLDNL